RGTPGIVKRPLPSVRTETGEPSTATTTFAAGRPWWVWIVPVIEPTSAAATKRRRRMTGAYSFRNEFNTQPSIGVGWWGYSHFRQQENSRGPAAVTNRTR